MLTICIPTLNRYDLLARLIQSAESGTLIPDKYLIVDNGGKFPITEPTHKIEIFNPKRNLGVAASWNWLIEHSEEIRIICNDDIEFDFDTLFQIVNNYDEKRIIYPAHAPTANIFSCFAISDYICSTIGKFDETISPNYAYFEDNDYARRIELAMQNGIDIQYLIVPCGYKHLGSSTINTFNDDEKKEHHRLFNIAKTNYIKKWGGLPHMEVFKTPYNK